MMLALVVLAFLGAAGCAPEQPRLKASEVTGNTEIVTNPSSSVVSFIAFGDWGYGGNPQSDVAQAISEFCELHLCDFILTLGDNFYPSGVQSVDDPIWQEKYRNVYGFLNLPFYVALGNHDYDGNVLAQIDYSLVDSTWHLPSEQYSFTWPEGSSNPIAEFFVVSTAEFTKKDQEWLEEAIENSRAVWKFFVRHYPFITNINVIVSNDPLMEKAICRKIDLVLSGHNHLFSLLRGPKNGCWLEQVIVGTGGAPLEPQSKDRDEGRLVTTASVYGFAWFQITENKALFQMISSEGTVVYRYTWSKP